VKIRRLIHPPFQRLLSYLRGASWQKPTGRRKLLISKRPDVVIAIGDIHGCHDLLVSLEQQIVEQTKADGNQKLIIMLGDYVDRGPDSQRVIAHLLAPPPNGFERICLAGNHEQAMLDFLTSPAKRATWLDWGGIETLTSYGIDSRQLTPKFLRSKMMRHTLDSHIPEEHTDFLKNLPSLVSLPGYIFAHAGIRPGVPIEKQSDNDLLWIRDDFMSADTLGIEDCVVHGHTPCSDTVVSPTRICIDTAAYATGKLTALKICSTNGISFITT